MKNAIINKGIIKKVANALGELNNDLMYVGGATVGLYINDAAADDVRSTKDLDISLSLVTLSELESIREELISRGFIQSPEFDVMCRFKYDDVIVDVMNTTELGWAPANSWFYDGFELKEMIKIENQNIFILPFCHFLATKFEAYNKRGRNEPRTSHDFEDIVYIIDNRIDLVEQLINAPSAVKKFLLNEFNLILKDSSKKEAIYSNLFYEFRDARYQEIIRKLEVITQ